MQFNDVTNNLGICQEIDALCDTDTTSYPVSAKTRRVNAAIEYLVGQIISADGNWQYDDTNHTTQPIGLGTLVEGQDSYTFATEYLKITQVLVKDTNARFRRLQPVDYSDLGGTSWEEYFGVDSSGNATKGFPEYYDIVGDSIRLAPAPTSTSVTLTNGIKIHFKRTVDLFTAADTTQEPGLPSSYHSILAYMASIPYCMAYKPERVPLYEKRAKEMERDLIKFYAKRNDDDRNIIIPRGIYYR